MTMIRLLADYVERAINAETKAETEQNEVLRRSQLAAAAYWRARAAALVAAIQTLDGLESGGRR